MLDRVMTDAEYETHAEAVLCVSEVLAALGRLPDDYKTHESIAVAWARLTDWLDDNRGRWTT